MKSSTLAPVLAAILLALVGLAMVVHGASKRRDLAWEALEARYASPRAGFLEMGGGVRLHYEDTGPRTGRTVLLAHGFTSSLRDWDLWANALDDSYRVVRVDLPGHGLTRAPEDWPASAQAYAELLDRVCAKLGLGRVTAVGNSMGGHAAWTLAVQRPERVEALVLVDSAGWPRGGPVSFAAHPMARALFGEVDLAPMLRAGLRASFADPARAEAELVQRYADFSRAPGHKAILWNLAARTRLDASPALLGRIQAPTLVLQGEADRLVPVADARRFAEAIPEARLIIYSGVGHMPQLEAPARSLSDLKAFLDALPPTARGAPVAPAATPLAPALPDLY